MRGDNLPDTGGPGDVGECSGWRILPSRHGDRNKAAQGSGGHVPSRGHGAHGLCWRGERSRHLLEAEPSYIGDVPAKGGEAILPEVCNSGFGGEEQGSGNIS